jgi:hypothetical protein
MGKNRILSLVYIFVLAAGIEAGGKQEFPRLQGPYLGQKPPGIAPQLFAPGIITSDEEEGSSGFARNGSRDIFWVRAEYLNRFRKS